MNPRPTVASVLARWSRGLEYRRWIDELFQAVLSRGSIDA